VNRLRRATAFVVILLLAQLTLVGSGFTCVSDAGSTNERAMADMPGMAGMPGSRAMPDMGGSPSQGANASEPAAPRSESCDLPWAPAGCALMIPCAPNAIPTLTVTSAAHGSPTHAEVVWELGAPPSTIITPDPPPPKA
jgi:hypothetical protein